MKKTVLALLILVIFVLTTGIAFAAPPPVIKTDAPLPSEVNIEAPAADSGNGIFTPIMCTCSVIQSSSSKRLKETMCI